MGEVDTEVKPLRVLLVDDNSTYRSIVRRILSSAGGVEVVGEAADGESSLTQASLLEPDVVVLDCAMPGMDGPEAALGLRRLRPRVRIIGLSVGDDEDCMRRMLEAGAETVVYKDDAATGLARAIAEGAPAH